ncbi:MAG TPA: protein kinase [Pyrinomonadaceae bacterium]|nr:protein kinase [Pyrinomonadaceae bacterium]
MSDKYWENIKDLFSEAIEKPPAERNSFLELRCSDDEMREEVRQLLKSYEEDDEFMEKAAVGEVADIIVTEQEKNLFDEPVGRYEIKSLLGEGGMGKVYLAKDTQLERLAAIKILSPYYSDDEHRIKRFFQEAKSASALNHPNILTIYEIGGFKETYFIAAEYVKGETLRQRQNRKRLSISEIIKVSKQVVSALKAAHEANIVHRDIKPENIMIRADGLVKILDFGLAKLIADKQNELDSKIANINQVNTAPRVVLGTVAYMSPEQARGKKTDFRTDIWSYGVCLYELIAGFSPFKGETMNDQIAEILTSEPPPLDSETPYDLLRIINKCLKKNADERYQNADELLEELKIYESSFKGNEQTEKITSYTEVQPTSGNRFKTVFTQLTAPIMAKGIGRAAFVSVLGMVLFLAAFGVYSFKTNSVYKPNPEAVRWYREASEAARNGNDFKAQKLLEQAVNIDAKYLPAQAKLAEIWFNRDYEDKAAQTMLKVTEQIPQLKGLSENEEIYLQAVTATVRRDYQAALESYRKISDRTPENEKTTVLFDVGKAFEKLEDSKNAAQIFEEVIRRDPQFAAAYLRLGLIYWFDDQREKSLEALQKAESIYSARSDYDGLCSHFYLKGSLYGYNNEFPEAEKYLNKALELSKATNNFGLEIRTILAIGGVEFSKGENAKGEKTIKEGLSLAQTENLEYFAVTGLIDLGTVYLNQSKFSDAETNFQQALTLARANGSKLIEAQALAMLGKLELDRDKPNKAILYLQPALSFFSESNNKPQESACLLNLSIAQIFMGKYDESIEKLTQIRQKAIETDDKLFLAVSEDNIGLNHFYKGNYKEALIHFKKGIELYDDQSLTQESGLSHAIISQPLIELGKFDEAKNHLRISEKSIEKSNDKELLNNINLLKSQIFLYENNFQETINFAQNSIKFSQNPKTENLIYSNLNCSLAELRRDNISKADEYFSKAKESLQDSENPKTSADLKMVEAEILLKKGLPNEALNSVSEAQEFFASANNKPALWRAVSLSLLASALLKDTQKISELKTESANLFISLKELFGNENFQQFRLRKDVQALISQTDKIKD